MNPEIERAILSLVKRDCVIEIACRLTIDGYGGNSAQVEATRALIGTRSKETFRLGGPVTVRLVEAAPFAGALRFEIMRSGAEPRGGRKPAGPTPSKASRRGKRR